MSSAPPAIADSLDGTRHDDSSTSASSRDLETYQYDSKQDAARQRQEAMAAAAEPPTTLEAALTTTTSATGTHLQHTTTNDFPDGGAAAWTVLLGTWAVFFSIFGLGNSVGVFQTYYVTQGLRAYPSSSISWIISFMLWVLNFLPIFWGFAFDRKGPRLLLCLGSATYVLGVVMVSLSTEYWHFFLAQGLLMPIGGSAVNTAAMSCLVTWFHRRRALVFGIMMSGSSVGGIVLPIMLTRLIARVGFPWAIRAAALVFAVLLSVACVTIRSRLAPATKPVDMRLYVRGVREPAMLATVGALFFVFWGIFLPYQFVILQARSQGMSADMVVYLLPILHSAGLFGRFASGVLADRLGRYNVTILITLLSGVSCLALWVPIASDAGVIAFMAVFGFLSSGISSLGPTLIAQISDIREIGARTGTAFAFQSFGLLTGSPIASAIVDARGGDYMGLQLFCGMSIFTAGVVFGIARVAQTGWVLRKKV